MQIMFTRLMPLWSAGGRQSQRGAVLSQARSDPLLTPRWAPSSPLGSSLCCRVRKAMGLCAGFAVADFKPICGEKIGLVLSPLVYSAYSICKSHKLHFLLLPSLFSLFCPHKQAKTKVTATVRIKYGSQHWHSDSGL